MQIMLGYHKKEGCGDLAGEPEVIVLFEITNGQ